MIRSKFLALTGLTFVCLWLAAPAEKQISESTDRVPQRIELAARYHLRTRTEDFYRRSTKASKVPSTSQG